MIPLSFWYLSLGGSAILLSYAIFRKDPVFILGQAFGSVGLHPQPHTHQSRENYRYRSMISCSSVWRRQVSDHPRRLLLLLWLITIVTGIGLRDPWPADEPRFALIAEEMVEGGDWLFPHRGGELYPDKPPLFMWTIAALLKVTGNLRIAFLLPSALSALAVLFLVYDLARRLWDEPTALRAGLVLLATFQFTLQGRSAQIDAMTCLWITLGLYGILRHVLQGPTWGWNYLGWASMGLGVITKGVGFLPLFLFIPLAIARLRDGEKILPRGKNIALWTASLIFLFGAIAIWLVPMLFAVYSSGSPDLLAYRNDILFHQTGERYARSWGHIRPVYYYLLNLIPAYWFPWSFLLPWLIPHWKKAIAGGDRRITLILGWVLLVILFFTASPGKRGVYLLPATPALAWAVAPYWTTVFRSPAAQRILWVSILVVSVILSLAGLGGAAGLVEISASTTIPFSLIILSFVLAVGGFLGCWIFRHQNPALAVAVFLALFWPLYGFWVYPLLGDLRTPKAVMTQVNQRMGPQDIISILNWREQFLLFSNHPVVHFGFNTPDDLEERAAISWLQEGSNRWLLAPNISEEGCFREGQGENMGYAHRRHWTLVTIEAVKNDCLESKEDFSLEVFTYYPPRSSQP